MFFRSGVPLQNWTSSLQWLGSTLLQRDRSGGEVGVRDRQGAAAVGYREARAGRGGVRGIALRDSRPPTRPQTDMSDITRYGRLCPPLLRGKSTRRGGFRLRTGLMAEHSSDPRKADFSDLLSIEFLKRILLCFGSGENKGG